MCSDTSVLLLSAGFWWEAPAGEKRRKRRDRTPTTEAGSAVLGTLTWARYRPERHDFLFGDDRLKEVDLLIWVTEEGGLS